MEDLFTELAGATHYSQIDLSLAYHQLPLHPESHNLTAFITHKGFFRFTRVPFGLASASSAIQKMMQTILKDLPGIQNYLDDIIIYGDSKENHDRNLQAVLKCLADACLQINFDKSSFNQTSIPFLVHIISKDGLHPSPEHLTAITEAPASKDTTFLPGSHFLGLISSQRLLHRKTLRSFLGLISWVSFHFP
ncbi:hypothetical protein LDENG_00193510 [Lucifuga dentata]|nr:hypothetical protein LDENG_00193510 [Lucifuga dentata]